MNKIEKIERNWLIAVLVSPWYWTGWSSDSIHKNILMFHPKLVELVEKWQEREISNSFLQKEFGIDVYTGWAGELEIQRVPKGTHFNILNYDGYESIVINDFEIA